MGLPLPFYGFTLKHHRIDRIGKELAGKTLLLGTGDRNRRRRFPVSGGDDDRPGVGSCWNRQPVRPDQKSV